MGCMLGSLRDQGVDESRLKPEWTTPMTVCYTEAPEDMPTAKCCLNRDLAWCVKKSNLQKVLPTSSPAGLLEACRARPPIS